MSKRWNLFRYPRHVTCIGHYCWVTVVLAVYLPIHCIIGRYKTFVSVPNEQISPIYTILKYALHEPSANYEFTSLTRVHPNINHSHISAYEFLMPILSSSEMWVIIKEQTHKNICKYSAVKGENKTQFRVLRTRKIQHSTVSIPAREAGWNWNGTGAHGGRMVANISCPPNQHDRSEISMKMAWKTHYSLQWASLSQTMNVPARSTCVAPHLTNRGVSRATKFNSLNIPHSIDCIYDDDLLNELISLRVETYFDASHESYCAQIKSEILERVIRIFRSESPS